MELWRVLVFEQREYEPHQDFCLETSLHWFFLLISEFISNILERAFLLLFLICSCCQFEDKEFEHVLLSDDCFDMVTCRGFEV